MRMLDCEEQVFVAGGFGSFSCPPCPEDCPITDEVTIPGKRNPSNSDPRFGATNLTIISGSINIMMFRDAWDAAVNAEELLRTESGRPAAIDRGDTIGLADYNIGFPVDFNSKFSMADEYLKSWTIVIEKLSLAEKTAFNFALNKAAKDAGRAGAPDVAQILNQLAKAVGNGNPGDAAYWSSYSHNLGQTKLFWVEVAVSNAYAQTAAIPGGI
jgi:hypothetical protein